MTPGICWRSALASRHPTSYPPRVGSNLAIKLKDSVKTLQNPAPPEARTARFGTPGNPRVLRRPKSLLMARRGFWRHFVVCSRVWGRARGSRLLPSMAVPRLAPAKLHTPCACDFIEPPEIDQPLLCQLDRRLKIDRVIRFTIRGGLEPLIGWKLVALAPGAPEKTPSSPRFSITNNAASAHVSMILKTRWRNRIVSLC